MTTLSLESPASLAARSDGLARAAVGLLGLYAAIFALWALAPGGPDDVSRTSISDTLFLAPGIVVAILAFRAATDVRLSDATRRAWRWLAVAYLAYWAGDVLWFTYEVVLEATPYPSLADAAYLGYYPLLLVGLLSFPRVLATRGQRIRFTLDALTVALGGAMVVWYFVLGPTAETGAAGAVEEAVALAYPVGDLILLLGLGANVIAGPRDLPRRSLWLLVGGLVVSFMADVAFGAQNLDGTYVPGRWVDALYAVSWAILGASAWRATVVDPPPSVVAGRRAALPLAPYLAVALGYGMLVAAIRTAWSPTLAGLVVGVGALTGLVVIRQAFAFGESVRLARGRDAGGQRDESRFRSLVQNASDLIVVLDGSFQIVFETPSVERVLGYRLEELQESQLSTLVPPEDMPAVQALLRESAERPGEPALGELRIRRADGRWLYVEASVVNVLDDPDVDGIVMTIRNIDERKRLELKLAHQAYHDVLTGLANRLLLQEEIGRAAATAASEGSSLAVLYVDVDNLKAANDGLGHEAGDRLLVEAAERIGRSIRTLDLAARVGGDEFAVLLRPPAGSSAGEAAAERILRAFRQRFEIDGTEVQLSASIGIAVGSGSEPPEDLLANADAAMYVAKREGKGRAVLHRAGMVGRSGELLDLEAALRAAIEGDELDLRLRPIVEIGTRRVVGASAHIHWDRPGIGRVSARDFLALADETGLIIPIGEWLLDRASRFAASWPGSSDGRPTTLTVPVTGRELRALDLAGRIRATLDRTGLERRRLVLEVPERLIADGDPTTIARLHELKALGIGLTIAEFGAGQSSLATLAAVPADSLKIDHSFAVDLDRASGSALVRGAVALGHSLGRAVIVDGIETPAQAAAVEAFGADLAEGDLFGRPVPAEEMVSLLP